ncbi:MAG: hypothetical protein PHE78_00240 [Candidatus Gastranaerophilales bacterium]|nr:hypothetical protein [Candidatus Gastranaerophilales bacterium]
MSKVVSQVLYYNQTQQYPSIQQDYKDVQKHVQKTDSADATVEKAALESIPIFRRVASLPDQIQQGNALPALGVAGLAFINIEEDMRDIKSAGSQIYGLFSKNHKHVDPYVRATHQHSFSFFRGTLIEEWLHKKIDGGNKVAQKLYQMDDTLLNTKFGEKLQNFFGIERIDSRRVDAIKDYKGVKARAYQFKSAKLGGEITARALQRLPLLSVAAVALLEVPKIFNVMGKGDNLGENITSTVKQTASSALNATSTLAGIGYGGAIGAKYCGAAGSLIGMGVGAVFGSMTSKKIQEVIS